MVVYLEGGFIWLASRGGEGRSPVTLWLFGGRLNSYVTVGAECRCRVQRQSGELGRALYCDSASGFASEAGKGAIVIVFSSPYTLLLRSCTPGE